MDEEILSTATDIDGESNLDKFYYKFLLMLCLQCFSFLSVDEDGVNYALPLSVHGSGYSQMHAVTSNKVEKLVSLCKSV